MINAENQPKIWGATIGFWIIFPLVLFVILLRYFTRPIQKPAQDLTELKDNPMSENLMLPQRYRGSLEISQLSHHINHLLQEIQLQQQQVKRQQQAIA
ncbi:hypothetical protein PEC18_34805 [Paucibacter sp. O1-1]|nr:hypothetical protein [Paucibacter sp. O1-1]MDA3830850.1 hypothetical protein [Paucibacter sp. O1-1]